MTDELPLTALCSICHNIEWKYRCPRCSAVTCSVACVTKHKVRASCSGKRDPAAYVKKSQLETATGIDCDFNFLTGVERAFDKAGNDASSRGIKLGANIESKAGSRKVEQAIIESQVDVRRAPKGLSRAKENHTDLIDGVTLNWTVEWFLPGNRRILKNCPINLSLSEGEARLHPRSKSLRREKKRKRGDEEATSKGRRDYPADGKCDWPAKSVDQTDPPTQQATTPQSNAPTPPPPPKERADSPTELIQYYYLHRPLCTGTSRVLIPMDSNTKLGDALAGKTVIEFPTIYVLHESEDELPTGFITEAVWRRQQSGIEVVAES